jgi:hypothetical protein
MMLPSGRVAGTLLLVGHTLRSMEFMMEKYLVHPMLAIMGNVGGGGEEPITVDCVVDCNDLS